MKVFCFEACENEKMSGISAEIRRLAADVLGLVCGISVFTVGAIALGQMNMTKLIKTGTGEGTAAINMIGSYGSVGAIIGACFIIIFLRDMLQTVKEMQSGMSD